MVSDLTTAPLPSNKARTVLSSSCTEIDIPAQAGDVASDDGMGVETRESRAKVDGNRLGRIWGCQGGCRAVSNNGGGIRSKCDRWGRDPLEGLGGQHDVRRRNDWMGE